MAGIAEKIGQIISHVEHPDLPEFEKAFQNNHPHYLEHRYQYGFTSHAAEGTMEPAAIIYPQSPHSDEDVFKAIKYATDHKIAIAVRTGGHQYSGISSTGGPNILLDMSEAYMEFEWSPQTGLLRFGVSFSLRELNKRLGENHIVVPTGQCSHVHVGGHAHTGGYGQMGRSFGLFGDHIEAIRVITADGVVHEISRSTTNEDDAKLFWAVLGGSPGNYGILTHVTIRPIRDADHPNSRGLKLVAPFNKDRLQELLEIMADMVSDDEFPGDFDYCVSCVSPSEKILPAYHILEWDKFMRTWHQDLVGSSENKLVPLPVMILYVQWANLKGEGQEYDPTWFAKIKKAAGKIQLTPINDDKHVPLSELAAAWVFQDVREFELPYNKRCYVTASTALKGEWPKYTAEAIDKLIGRPTSGCKIVSQIQHFGGKYSSFRNNDSERKTSYSWRDSSVVCVLDCFYEPVGKPLNLAIEHGLSPAEISLKWVTENDKALVGPNGIFSKIDRRVLWGTYSQIPIEKNMGYSWKFYHEDQEKYDKLVAIKRQVDPNNIFTPNEFCVGVDPTWTSAQAKGGLQIGPLTIPLPRGGGDCAGLDKTLAQKLREARKILIPDSK